MRLLLNISFLVAYVNAQKYLIVSFYLPLDDCQWNDWTDDTKCSKTCGYGSESGVKTQKRTKKKPEGFGGSCDDQYSQSVACTTHTACPGITYDISNFLLTQFNSFCNAHLKLEIDLYVSFQLTANIVIGKTAQNAQRHADPAPKLVLNASPGQ